LFRDQNRHSWILETSDKPVDADDAGKLHCPKWFHVFMCLWLKM